MRGDLTATTDAEGITTSYEYDALGRLTAVVENYMPGTQPTAEINVRTEYTYGANGNRLTIQDGNNHTTTFAYDAMNRLLSETDPLGNMWSHTYDTLGNRASMTDANGAVTNYAYDNANRLTLIDYETSADVYFTYDPGGRRVSMTDGSGTTTWAYNALNQPTAITDPFGKTVSYNYDSVGNKTSIVYPDSQAVSYAYDPANRLTTVGGSSPTVNYQYDEANRLVQVSRPGNINSVYSYDAASRLLSITHAQGLDQLSSFQYLYDNVGNRIQAIENIVQPTLPTPTPTHSPTPTSTDTPTSTPTTTPTFTPTAQTSVSIEIPIASSSDDAEESASGSVSLSSSDLELIRDANIQQVGLRFTNVTIPQGTTILNAYVQFTVDETTSETTTLTIQGEAKDNPVTFGYSTATKISTRSRTTSSVSWSPSAWLTFNESGMDQRTPDLSPILQELVNRSGWNSGNAIAILLTGTGKRVAVAYEGGVNGAPRLFVEYTTSSAPTATPVPSNTPTSTSTPANTSTPTSASTPTNTSTPGLIFGDGFESGNFSAWTSSSTDGGDLFASSQAAAVGSYGLEALIDDTVDIDVTDVSPNNETHYSARFYLDPNSVNLPNNESMYVFTGSDDAYNWKLCLGMKRMAEYYALTLCGQNDANSWFEGRSAYITDDWQAVEIEWQAASADGANDGFAKLWINDVLVDTLGGLDTDSSRISRISLGASDSVPAGSNGSIYFDAFESRQGEHIGLDPNGPTLSAPSTDLVFKDDFESGDFSLWSSTTLGGGDLSISSPSAIFGSYGMQAVINDTASMNVTDSSPADETQYHARFYLDPNSISIPNNNGFSIFSAGGDAGSVFRVTLNNSGGSYTLQTQAYHDAGGMVSGQPIVITDEPQVIEAAFQASSAAGVNDGYFELWVNDVLVDTIPNLDNDARLVEYVNLGATSGIDTGTSGAIYFDQFEAHYSAHIGPYSVSAIDAPAPLAHLPGNLFAISFHQPQGFQIKSDAPASFFQQQQTTTTINYVYDPLYRLTSAAYSTGNSYQYTYDAVGNRLTASEQSTVTNYQYDAANRLTSAGGVGYTWDANGNLLNDGANTYTYDSANRLTSVLGPSPSTYTYNGLGDRLSQTIDGMTTNYTLDLNAGLTQVLSDGTTNYAYGMGRISQQQGSTTEYFLGDALGSVRQMTNQTGAITFAQTYDPYGAVTHSSGLSSHTDYGFTGESYSPSTQLTYLRARYYNPADGRFTSRDTWGGDVNRPLSLNRWGYVEGNPVNWIDPSGFSKCNCLYKYPGTVPLFFGTGQVAFEYSEWGEWFLNDSLPVPTGITSYVTAEYWYRHITRAELGDSWYVEYCIILDQSGIKTIPIKKTLASGVLLKRTGGWTQHLLILLVYKYDNEAGVMKSVPYNAGWTILKDDLTKDDLPFGKSNNGVWPYTNLEVMPTPFWDILW